MKVFLKGLLIFLLLFVSMPILFPLMVIDIIFVMGGRDPFDTPITPIREWIGDKLP